MHLYPTRSAAHVAVAGVAVVAVGVAAQQAAIVAWGGGVLVALALARAITLVSVARIRAAGFEMLWSGPKRVARTVRGGTVELEAEVRNRDTLSARYVKLRAIASSQLEVTIEPNAGEVAASGRLKVKVRVHALRVGHHGVHGLALEVLGAPGLFEVPLTFGNPYGIEVLPRQLGTYLMHPRGGRSRLAAATGRPGRLAGDGTDLRELRDHQPGDPFRKIAWKASARRGQLLVREFEREERDVAWIVLDASVELWGGAPGKAPLDHAIDEAASLTSRHLVRGDRVGLFVVASTARACIPPDHGPAQAQRITHALLTACATYDAERSDLDEYDVAVRVLEHLRPLDPRGLVDVRRGDLDKLAARADAMRGRAPFIAAPPEAKSARERSLRRYLASYGIESPPRTEPERPRTSQALPRALGSITRMKPKPTIVHVLAMTPDRSEEKALGDAVRRLTRGGGMVTWSVPPFDAALEPPWERSAPPLLDAAGEAAPVRVKPAFGPNAPIAADAVRMRARIAQARGERLLRRLGVKLPRQRGFVPLPVEPNAASAEPEVDDGAATRIMNPPPATA